MNLSGFHIFTDRMIRQIHQQIMAQAKTLPTADQLPGLTWMAEVWMIQTCQMLRALRKATAAYDREELDDVERRIATEVSKLQTELEDWRR